MMLFAFLQAATDAGTAGPADLLTDPEVAAAVKALMEAQGAGPLAILGGSLFLVNLIIRKGGLKYLPPGKVTDFLKTRAGGWVLNVTLALGGGLSSMGAAGTPFTVGNIASTAVKSLVTMAVAVMANELHKDVVAAKDAGKAAAENDGPGPSATA